MLKRGYNPDLMDLVVSKLADGEPLEPKYCDHELKGEYTGYRECHITPDGLLISKLLRKSLFYTLPEPEPIVIFFKIEKDAEL